MVDFGLYRIRDPLVGKRGGVVWLVGWLAGWLGGWLVGCGWVLRRPWWKGAVLVSLLRFISKQCQKSTWWMFSMEEKAAFS